MLVMSDSVAAPSAPVAALAGDEGWADSAARKASSSLGPSGAAVELLPAAGRDNSDTAGAANATGSAQNAHVAIRMNAKMDVLPLCRRKITLGARASALVLPGAWLPPAMCGHGTPNARGCR